MLRDWPVDGLEDLYERMRGDFPANERPPKNSLIKQIKKGELKALCMDAPDLRAAAYALCAGDEAVLITHLAVKAGFRANGYGTMLLEELSNTYRTKSSYLIVEVELPEKAKQADERATREKRIAFYTRAGFSGYLQVPYSIFGVPMMLMVKSLNGKALPSEALLKQMVKAAYSAFLPSFLMGQVRFI
jgi:Acetyltransferases